MKITIIGTGNMGGAIARGLAKGSKSVNASDITCTATSPNSLKRIQETNAEFKVTHNNVTAVKGADIIILAVKPWILPDVIREIKQAVDYEKQIIVSIAGGIPFSQLSDYFQQKDLNDGFGMVTLFRVIPNTAIEVLSSMTFISSYHASKEQEELIIGLFNTLGLAMLIPEDKMTAATALGSCGTAFALRYIRAASEGGVELGFRADLAAQIVAQTVKGAAELLLTNQTHPEAEIDKVTTPGGITIKGLNEMEAAGFTAAVIRGLKASK